MARLTKRERELREIAQEFGGTVSLRRSGHFSIHLPNGVTYSTGSTPGDWRARRKLIADLRRLSAG